MKIVFYGASVTAQKGDSGYFDQLSKIIGDQFDLIRVPFGASHLQFAGLAMIQKVLDQDPDYCILDWVTPSTKSFPEGIVDRINDILIANNIVPIWVLFPRTDDADCSRECCQEVLASRSEFVKVFSFQDSKYKEPELSLILRDVVHTNSIGAKRYANFISEIIRENCFKIKLERLLPYKRLSIPKILTCEGTLSVATQLSVRINVLEETSITVYCLAEIGPSSPMIEIQLISNDKVLQSYSRNVVDPWCYYYRKMLVNLPTFKQVPQGVYNIIIKVSPVNPFENIETLKPIPENMRILDNSKRYLQVIEFAIDGTIEVEKYNYGI